MNYPLINKQAMRTVNIPELSGGINLRDAIYSVNDNQLCDCKNVWFKDGILRTRPGSKGLEINTFFSKDYEGTYENKEWEIYKNFNGVDYKLHSFSCGWFEINEAGILLPSECLNFYFVPDSKEYPEAEAKTLPALPFAENYFVVEAKGEIYVFSKCRENVYDSDGGLVERNAYNGIYKWYKDELNFSPSYDGEWQKLENKDLYIPTVMTDCKCSADGKSDFSAAPGEAYNKINDLCKIEYSSVNRDLLDISDETSTHEMRYYIPNVALPENIGKIKDYFSLKITYSENLKDANGADLTDEEGNLIYTVEHKLGYFNNKKTFYEFEPGTANTQPDKVWIAGMVLPDGSMRVSFFTNEKVVTTDLKVKTVTQADYLRNNMVITMPCVSDGKDEIFFTDISTWYGGETSGIFGGTRLFLASNGSNRIIRSDLNNPLYFPEDCDMEVGNANEGITAFGKQNEQLVIFKEHSVWGSNYVFNSDITGEQLINQTVVNYEANTAYFPLIQLHPHIGCRVPQSIQLCRNRLVWADSNGKVYTLVSQSQYNERNVYELSDMIEKRLKECSKEDLINATSADWDGHYVLCVGNKLFLMDYNCYGYSHCYSYSKSEDGQKLIPWWYWEIPLKETENVERIYTFFENLYYILSDTSDEHNALGGKVFKVKNFSAYSFDENISTDEGKTIQSLIETKCFSFGTFSYTKHIAALNMALHGSGDIRITYISDKPELMSEEIFSLYSDDVQIGSPSYMQNILFRPNMRFTALFGVRLETEQGIAIGPVSLNYRLLGGNN